MKWCVCRRSGYSNNYDLDPKKMVCKLAAKTRNENAMKGKGMNAINLSRDGCQARSIVEILAYLSKHAIPRSSTGSVDMDYEDDCDYLATETLFSPMGLTLYGVESRALRGRNMMKRELMATGPLIIIMRLTEEFSQFTGKLFNTDKFSYLDRNGEVLKPGVVAPESEWNNHFMVVVGWATTSEGVSAWVVLNSWGAIYEKSVHTSMMDTSGNEKGQFTMGTMIAMDLDGPGKLEITNRIAYMIGTPMATDLRESYYKVDPKSVVPVT
jgi:hypothetical protein